MTQDNDPWGNNPQNTDGNELSSLFDKIKDSLLGKKGGSSAPRPNNSGLPEFPKKIIFPAVLVALIGWGATGVYVLPDGLHGVELVFGKYSQTATQSGLNMRWPVPIGSVKIIDVEGVKNLTVGGKNNTEGQMLTADENIVEVSLSVQYKIGEAEKYLFNVNDPETVLRETLISSIREVVGGSSVDYVLTDGRTEWPNRVRESLVNTLKGFDVGFDIIRVELRNANAPAAVQAAFDDAVKAREDRDRYKLQAEAYQNERIPLARGQAQEILEQAQAYKASVIAKATGEASRFNDVLKSYQKAPQITRDRMYIETLQDVYQNVNNIVVATGENAPVMYLPMGQNLAAPIPPVEKITKKETKKLLLENSKKYETKTLPEPVVTNKRLTR